MVRIEPPSYPYIEITPCINLNEGSLALMWDKKKGNSMYDQRNDNSWLGPYIVKKKYDK
jgi:aromatic ring-cleaving dioxygenase